MPNDKSANQRANNLIGIDGGKDAASEHFGFGRNATNQSTGPRVINVTVNPNGVITAPAGSLALGDNGQVYQNTDGAVAWSALSNTSSDVFLAPNEYYVDSTQAAQPAERIYPTIEDALVAIETDFPGGEPCLIRCREAQNHTWDGSGVAALSTRLITIYAASSEVTIGGGTTVTVFAGAIADAGSPNALIRFQNLVIAFSGDFSVGDLRRAEFANCTVTGSDGKLSVGALTATNTPFDGLRFDGVLGKDVVYNLLNCSISLTSLIAGAVLFDDADNGSSITNCALNFDTVNGVLYEAALGGGTLTLAQCQIHAIQSGGGVATLFNTQPGTLSARVVGITYDQSGVGSLDFGDGGDFGTLREDSYFTQSGETITRLPFVSNFAGAIALARSIASPSTSIPGTNEALTPFNRTITIPGNTITKAGDVITICGQTRINALTLGSTGLWNLLIGGNVFSSLTIAYTGVNGAIDWSLRLMVTTVGAAGDFRRSGTLFSKTTDAAAVTPTINAALTIGPIDWTIDNDIEVEWMWPPATPDDSEVTLEALSAQVARAGYN